MGQQREATVDGLPGDQARDLLRGVSTHGPAIAWDGSGAPGWSVVHERKGTPCSTSRHHLDWYLRFTVDGVERSADVDVRHDDAIPLESSAGVGTVRTSVPGPLRRPRSKFMINRTPRWRPHVDSNREVLLINSYRAGRRWRRWAVPRAQSPSSSPSSCR